MSVSNADADTNSLIFLSDANSYSYIHAYTYGYSDSYSNGHAYPDANLYTSAT